MKRFVCALSIALVAAAPAAWSQTPAAASEDLEATTVDELVVRATVPGPAWWRVSDGDTTVWVLGVPDALPKGTKWDQTTLKRRLKGAHTVIYPPVFRAGANPLAIPKLYQQYREASRSGVSLQASLPPALAARYLAAVAKAGKKPKDYDNLRVWFAGLSLSGDYRKRMRLDYEEPMRSIGKAVKAARLKPVPAMTEDMKLARLLETLKSVSDATGRECLDAVVDEIEGGDGVVRRAAAAWAAGDVPAALGSPRSTEACWGVVPGAARLKRESWNAQADAIDRALKKPGHAVAILGLRGLVAREGVLQRLKARGYEVRAPQ